MLHIQMKMFQAFLPLLKQSAAAIGGSDLSISRAAVVNISSELGSLKYSTEGTANYGFSYKCSKVWSTFYYQICALLKNASNSSGRIEYVHEMSQC